MFQQHIGYARVEKGICISCMAHIFLFCLVKHRPGASLGEPGASLGVSGASLGEPGASLGEPRASLGGFRGITRFRAWM